ncbi:MAG: hypothetical protein AAGD05_17695 [Bacteroidota bacterium]
METTTDHDIEALIENELLTKKSKQSDIYAGAAEYLLYRESNLYDAITLTNSAIAIDENNGWARSLKIRIYERMKLYDQILAAIVQYQQYAESRDWENEAEKQNTLTHLKPEHKRISSLKP